VGGAERFEVIVGRDERGVWFVRCPGLPGCVSTGATREEAMANIKAAIALCRRLKANADDEAVSS
jgi:predicted RNase H-like HicB family nuclease